MTKPQLTKTQSKEEEEVKYNVALCNNNSVSLEKTRRQLNKTMPDKNIHNVCQSDVLLNENTTRNTFNNEATIVQGPMDDNDKITLQKAWTMELPRNDGDFLMTMTSGPEQANRDYRRSCMPGQHTPAMQYKIICKK